MSLTPPPQNTAFEFRHLGVVAFLQNFWVCRLQCVGVATTSASAAAAQAVTAAEANTMPVWLCIRIRLALSLSLFVSSAQSSALSFLCLAFLRLARSSLWSFVPSLRLDFWFIVVVSSLFALYAWLHLPTCFYLLSQTSLCKVHAHSECPLWPFDLCIRFDPFCVSVYSDYRYEEDRLFVFPTLLLRKTASHFLQRRFVSSSVRPSLSRSIAQSQTGRQPPP